MQVVTPKGRAFYAFVFRPQEAMQKDRDPNYALTLAFDKDSKGIKRLQDAIEAVAKEKFGVKAAALLKSGQLKNPLRDGDVEREGNEQFAGKLFLTARSKDKPPVVDMDAEPLMSQDDFYSGCYARMDVWFYAFDKAGNKGVAGILNNVQKLGDGERVGGRRSAAEAFGADEDEELI